jgi:hypothetical protein
MNPARIRWGRSSSLPPCSPPTPRSASGRPWSGWSAPQGKGGASGSEPRQRLAYITPVLQLSALHGRLFAAHFTDTTTYVPCILTAITRAVIAGAAGEPARVTILIDGLQKGVRQGAAAALRAQLQPQQIRLEKVRGLDEQSDALMRLADALAGFVRHGLEGRPDMAPLLAESHRQGILHLLQT